MTDKIYTVITFAPVQGFIEKSRKLRDLYGSSYLLSYLSWVICNAADNHTVKNKKCSVVSPALPNITQGMPNQIIIKGNFPEKIAKSAVSTAWKCVVKSCREWIEKNVTSIELNDNNQGTTKVNFDYTPWKRTWKLWENYAWEFFWVQGEPGDSISDVREKLNEKKRGRDWTGINWQGESSTLSGADAIAYPKLGQIADPRNYNYQQEKQDVIAFYKALSNKLGESFIKSFGLKISDDKLEEKIEEYGKSFIDPDEELSIPELIKRLITHHAVNEKLNEQLKQVYGNNGLVLKKMVQQIKELSDDLNPYSFDDLSRSSNSNKNSPLEEKERIFSGWFQGDGDKAGEYLKSFANKEEEGEEINKFSEEMRKWGEYFKQLSKDISIKKFRVVYAGGDDFLGVFYNRKDASDCVDFFSRFKTDIWDEGKTSEHEKKKITASVGFVWSSSGIPQRDVLQHCREAERSAKNNGRDRIAFRVLFNNGNHLEWVCPWWLLESGLLSGYRDREGGQNWTHIYGDVAVLESRHALGRRNTGDDEDDEDICQDTGMEVAEALFKIYFPDNADILKQDGTQDKYLWNRDEERYEGSEKYERLIGGILGDRKSYYHKNTEELNQNKVDKALTNWIVNLAKVGFHLCQK